eukprot:TRINITY_DN9727_c0_g1_i1.p1 TRINITY_DN9727_c0_g1~~TRINITY_DN9727_c0_g1_i1.p1  ORF type:complete len:297 (+),score=43.61 TRINITY_DN9727_c0_g1_i1:31-921(+)
MAAVVGQEMPSDDSTLDDLGLGNFGWLEEPSIEQLNLLLLEVSGALPKTPPAPATVNDVSSMVSYGNNSPSRAKTWNTARPTSRDSNRTIWSQMVSTTESSTSSECSSVPLFQLSGDVLGYILSFLWPIRELFNTRLSCTLLKLTIENLRVACDDCGGEVGWRAALVCDDCLTTTCRGCAGVQTMPLAKLVKTFPSDRCGSCHGRLHAEWQSCPWCETVRQDRQLLSSFRLKGTSKNSKRPQCWGTHPCGHSMQHRRTCPACTTTCSRCHSVACSQCIWKDGSRRACYGCTVMYGR